MSSNVFVLRFLFENLYICFVSAQTFMQKIPEIVMNDHDLPESGYACLINAVVGKNI